VLRVHQSNFRTLGFVEDASIEELCSLAVPVIDDVGSGALAEGVPELRDEPPVRHSVAAGTAVVCFSGDKLLGGPQAGLMAGRAEAIDRCRAHPLARALRIDKLSLAALEAVLRLYRDGGRPAIPVLRMLTAGRSELAERANRMRGLLSRAGVEARAIEASAKAGGGALAPRADRPGVRRRGRSRGRRRSGRPPASGGSAARRPHPGGLALLDPRTLTDADADLAARAVVNALR
jgi:L-seryl-tRNA(Ser) seleniumtransferase